LGKCRYREKRSMNVFTAMILSTSKFAQSLIYSGILAGRHPMYRLKVSQIGENNFLFQIFYATYPDRKEGKGYGEPHFADKAHFAKNFTLNELTSFLEEHFTLDEWQPVEDE
jgi:hypothetical protein